MWIDTEAQDDFNGEEASFHYMIMDLEHFIKKDGVKLVDSFISQEIRNKIIEYYASKR